MFIIKKPITILYSLFAMVIITLAFQNCSAPFESAQDSSGVVDPTDLSTGDELLSLSIFEKTLYNDIQQNCAGCHGTTQQPLFAVAQSLDSHRLIFSKEYVNLEVPENSYLAIKIRAGHNKFPVELADQFVASITKWSDDLRLAMEPEDKPPEEKPPEEKPPEEKPPEEPPEEKPPEEPPVNAKATFTSIYNTILVPKCLSCHKPKSEGGLGLSDDYRDYNTTMTTGSVVVGDASKSDLYKEVNSGKMPPAGSLTAEEIANIKIWIDNGAENN